MTRTPRRRGWRRWGVLVPTALALLAVLALAALQLVPPAGAPRTGSQGLRLVDDTAGAIAEWSLGLAEPRAPYFLATQVELLLKVDPRIRFRVAYANREARAAFEQALRASGFRDLARISWVEAPRGVSPWLRDFWLAGRRADGEPCYLIQHPDTYSQMRAAWSPQDVPGFVARLAAGRAVPTRARVEGGVVVTDAERAFASPAPFRQALGRGETTSEEEYERGLEGIWGLPVETLHPGVAGHDFHADLYLAPIGQRRIVLGSPRLALALLKGIAREEQERFQRGVLAFAARAPGDDPLRKLVEGDVLDALIEVNGRPARLQAFENIRRQLEGLGYVCSEVPCLVLAPSRTGAKVALSYTNVVQEQRGGTRTVYVPTFRLPTLDRAAAQTWRKLGRRVVGIEALGPALNGGGLRCLSQVIRE